MRSTIIPLLWIVAVAVLLAGCDDAGIRVFSDKVETKILNVIYQGSVPYIDDDGDGTFETPLTEAKLEVLQAEGWQVRVIGGPSQ